jgi:two-component system, cell cycle sensor histidine kinase and response regulator CckA
LAAADLSSQKLIQPIAETKSEETDPAAGSVSQRSINSAVSMSGGQSQNAPAGAQTKGESVESSQPQEWSTKRAPPVDTVRTNRRRIERREWQLWIVAILVSLILLFGLMAFILPSLGFQGDSISFRLLPPVVQGLVALVLIFDLYTIFQQLQIHRMRGRLAEREELFRLISENAADMIAVVDMEGRRIFNSDAYQKILGYSADELKNSSPMDQIHPEDRQRVKEAAADARRTGSGKNLEYRIRHKNGNWRVLESTSSVIGNVQGVPEKLVIVNRDITERKLATEALRLSEISFRSVIENAPYGIYRAEPSGKLLLVNPALQKMLGYESQDELLRVNLATDVHGHPLENRTLNDLFASQKEFTVVEVEWKRKDGTPIKARCTGWMVGVADGSATYFEVFAEDVTEKWLLERQLRMAQKMEAIGRLSGGIAHDFNNLLGVIIGYSQVLKRTLPAGSPFLEHAEEIEKAGQRAASLTRQLLAFSRQQVLAPAVIDLNNLISEMQKLLPRLIGENIETVVSLDRSIGRVKADKGQIEQVIMNLVVNARDAMPKGGKILITTSNASLDEYYTRYHAGSKVGEYVMLSVSDSGSGIDPETLAHIFEPFFTTKEQGKGTGLGLATVYGVVKQSGGYVWVKSILDKGTSFEIYLPRIEEPVAIVEAIASPEETLHGSETILLVEDSAPLRKLGHMLLSQHGYRVLSAADGVAALEKAEESPGRINLLLTDVIMPGLNGHDLAKRLLLTQPELKVLYMSGYTDDAIVNHGVLESGTHLLPKPFSEESLIRKVREVLNADQLTQPTAGNGFILAGTRESVASRRKA